MVKSKTRTSTSTPSATTGIIRLVTDQQSCSPPSSNEPETEARVTWDETTIDNEFLGRKKSKKCCIYHKSSRLDDYFNELSDELDNRKC